MTVNINVCEHPEPIAELRRIYDTAAAQPILRGGGPADYFQLGPDALFKMRRPSST